MVFSKPLRMKSQLAVLMAVTLACLSLGWSPARGAEVVDRIVAVVNGEMITLSELNANLALVLKTQEVGKSVDSQDADVQELRRQVLDKMINDILLEAEAERYEIEVSETEVQEYIDAFISENNLTRDQLKEYLAAQGMTLESYREKIKSNIVRSRLITAMVRRKAVVTDEEIEAYYESHKQELAGGLGMPEPGGLELSLIVFDSPETAASVREQILAGQVSFAEAARQYSRGPAADQGGNLGSVQIPDLVPELRAVAEKLPPGQVSTPFTLSGQPAIIVLKSKGSSPTPSASAGGAPPLTEVKEQIRAILEEPKMEALFDEYTKRLRDQALIDIKL